MNFCKLIFLIVVLFSSDVVGQNDPEVKYSVESYLLLELVMQLQDLEEGDKILDVRLKEYLIAKTFSLWISQLNKSYDSTDENLHIALAVIIKNYDNNDLIEWYKDPLGLKGDEVFSVVSEVKYKNGIVLKTVEDYDLFLTKYRNYIYELHLYKHMNTVGLVDGFDKGSPSVWIYRAYSSIESKETRKELVSWILRACFENSFIGEESNDLTRLLLSADKANVLGLKK